MKLKVTREQAESLKATVNELFCHEGMDAINRIARALDDIVEEAATPDRDGFDTGPLRWEPHPDGGWQCSNTYFSAYRVTVDEAWDMLASVCKDAARDAGSAREQVNTWHAVVERDVSEPPDSHRLVMGKECGVWSPCWYDCDHRRWWIMGRGGPATTFRPTAWHDIAHPRTK